MNPLARGRLQVLGACVCFSFAGALVKLVSPPLDAWHVAGLRSLCACFFLAALLKPWRARPWRPGPKILALALAYALCLTLFILANTRTTSANAIFLQDTGPVWVLVLAPWVVREAFRARDFWTVVLCGVGMSLFFKDQIGPGERLGNLLALVSGFFYGLIILGMRWGRPREDAPAGARGPSASEQLVVWGNLAAFLISLPWMGALPPAREAVAPLALVAGMGCFQLGLGYLLMTRGLASVPAVEGALLALIEPVLNPVWAFLVVGERPGPWALAGGALVLVAVAFQPLRESLAAAWTSE